MNTSPRPSAPALASSALLAGTLAGVAAALLDGLVLLEAQGSAHLEALPYALAVGALAGAALGAVAALLLVLGRALGAAGPRLAFLPVATVAVAAFAWLNRDLFEGPRIREHPRLPLIKAAFYGGGALAIVAAVLVFPLLGRRGKALRRAAAAALVVAAAGLAWAGLRFLNAYPMVKVQLALGTWVALAAAIVLARGGRSVRPARALAAAIFVVLAALGVAALARGAESIYRRRSLIIDAPFPATYRAIGAVEDLVLARLFPLPAIGAPGGAGEVVAAAGDPRLQEELDRLAPGRRGMNVVWISIDALRADHVTAFGYARPTTPRIDALARESVLFRRAITPTPASALAYSSTLNGVFGRVSPSYKIQHDAAFEVPAGSSIAGVLRSAGRRTAGLTAFYASTQSLDVFATFPDGFDVFNPGPRGPALPADQVTTRALDMLDRERLHRQPFFLWVHYLDPHAPYDFVAAHDFGRLPLDAYDSEIAFCDGQIGRFLDALAERGLDRDTIVVLFADHGEAFGEHNNRFHGQSLYSHQIHVPLMIRVPGLAPREVAQWVSLSDLAPTTLALLGVPDPFKRLGRDLTPLLLGRPDGWVDSAYSERPAPPRDDPPSQERAVCAGDLKLIWKPHDRTIQVFDLARDPGESRNLFDPADPAHQRLQRIMAGWDARIDTFHGGEASSAPVARRLSDVFAEQVEAVLAAGEDAALEAALRGVDEIVDAPSIARDPVNKARLGEPALARLSDHLVSRLPSIEPRSKARSLAVETLVFLDDPAFVPLFEREMARPTAPRLALTLVAFRARHGDRSVLPLLEAGFEGTTIPEKLVIAEALGRLGDGRGRLLLRSALDATWEPAQLAAVRGLGALGDPAALDALLFSEEKVWKKTRILDAALPAALADRTSRGNAALLRIANEGGPGASAPAEAALAERVPASVLERSSLVAATISGARENAVYRRHDLVITGFEPLGEADDALVGPGWWFLLQAAWEKGDAAAMDRAAARLGAAMAGDPAFARLLERLPRHRHQKPRPPRAKLAFEARLVGDVVFDVLRTSRLFYATVEVTNRSGAYVCGGWWRDNPLLGFAIATDAGVAPPVHTTPLPIEGLEPGESVTLVVLGQWPKEKGPCRPRLVAVVRLDKNPLATLLELPERTIE